MLVEKIALNPKNPDVILTTYILDDSPELLAGGKRPAVVICPGGAYLNCSDREAEAVALRFASMGYHAFVLRYSVYKYAGEELMDMFAAGEVREKSIYPAPIHDIARALTTIYDKADAWLVDRDKIALCGFSAGGHNVTNYAIHFDKPVITDYFETEKVKPAAIIAGYPLTDYLFMKESVSSQDEVAQGLFRLSNISFLGKAVPSDEELLEVSPARLVDASTPPMFLWSTAGDNLVPVGHTTRLATALADAGVPFEVHIYEEGDHGLSLANQATAKAKTEVNEIASEWPIAAEKWLQKRFALPLKEKSEWRKD